LGIAIHTMVFDSYVIAIVHEVSVICEELVIEAMELLEFLDKAIVVGVLVDHVIGRDHDLLLYPTAEAEYLHKSTLTGTLTPYKNH
jgi:hypothetical protein